MLAWERLARQFAGVAIRGPDDAAHVVREVFGHGSCHRDVVLTLDDDQHLVRLLSRVPDDGAGEPSRPQIAPVGRGRGVGCVVATLRPGPPVAPCAQDLEVFHALATGCAANDVKLYDWLIFVDHRWWSMRERVAGLAHPK